jgi:hypothetical protein
MILFLAHKGGCRVGLGIAVKFTQDFKMLFIFLKFYKMLVLQSCNGSTGKSSIIRVWKSTTEGTLMRLSKCRVVQIRMFGIAQSKPF